jgi:phenylalanyl-tRNA synthetase beta subunit
MLISVVVNEMKMVGIITYIHEQFYQEFQNQEAVIFEIFSQHIQHLVANGSTRS